MLSPQDRFERRDSRFRTGSAEDGEAFGCALASLLRDGDTLAFFARPGAGKTVMTRGIAAGLGISEAVSSPSFVILLEYPRGKSGLSLDHFDCYRLSSEEEWYDLGFSDYPRERSVAVIEWAERIANCLPVGAIRLAITADPDNESVRNLELLDPSGHCLSFPPDEGRAWQVLEAWLLKESDTP